VQRLLINNRTKDEIKCPNYCHRQSKLQNLKNVLFYSPLYACIGKWHCCDESEYDWDALRDVPVRRVDAIVSRDPGEDVDAEKVPRDAHGRAVHPAERKRLGQQTLYDVKKVTLHELGKDSYINNF
jgi:hypothetical protein